MLLLITISPTLIVNLHSDDNAITAKAHEYLRDRMHEVLGDAVARDQGPADVAGTISSSITGADRVAFAAIGFKGVAVVQLFEAHA